MSTTTNVAFAPLSARAAANGGPFLDRISVRDYVREVEIGAFTTERGVTQRVRFSVVLEVSAHTAAQDDDVDKVLSYDTIIQAIEAELEAERINLLETLAERVASHCLLDPRAVRAFVRIEKLDRIPGALGVEIVRTRIPDEAATLHRADMLGDLHLPKPKIIIVNQDIKRDSLDILAQCACKTPIVLISDCLSAIPDEMGPDATRHVTLLSMAQAAYKIAEQAPDFIVVESRTELEYALRNGQVPIWAPARIVNAATNPPQDVAPTALAEWLSVEIGASTVEKYHE